MPEIDAIGVDPDQVNFDLLVPNEEKPIFTPDYTDIDEPPISIDTSYEPRKLREKKHTVTYAFNENDYKIDPSINKTINSHGLIKCAAKGGKDIKTRPYFVEEASTIIYKKPTKPTFEYNGTTYISITNIIDIDNVSFYYNVNHEVFYKEPQHLTMKAVNSPANISKYLLTAGYIPEIYVDVLKEFYTFFCNTRILKPTKSTTNLTMCICEYMELEVMIMLYWKTTSIDLLNWNSSKPNKNMLKILYTLYSSLNDEGRKLLEHNINLNQTPNMDAYSLDYIRKMWPELIKLFRPTNISSNNDDPKVRETIALVKATKEHGFSFMMFLAKMHHYTLLFTKKQLISNTKVYMDGMSNSIKTKLLIFFNTKHIRSIFPWLTENQITSEHVVEFNIFFIFYIKCMVQHFVNIGVELANPTSLISYINELTWHKGYQNTLGKLEIATKRIEDIIKLNYRTILCELDLYLTNNAFSSTFDKDKKTFYKDKAFVNHVIYGFIQYIEFVLRTLRTEKHKPSMSAIIKEFLHEENKYISNFTMWSFMYSDKYDIDYKPDDDADEEEDYGLVSFNTQGIDDPYLIDYISELHKNTLDELKSCLEEKEENDTSSSSLPKYNFVSCSSKTCMMCGLIITKFALKIYNEIIPCCDDCQKQLLQDNIPVSNLIHRFGNYKAPILYEANEDSSERILLTLDRCVKSTNIGKKKRSVTGKKRSSPPKKSDTTTTTTTGKKRPASTKSSSSSTKRSRSNNNDDEKEERPKTPTINLTTTTTTISSSSSSSSSSSIIMMPSFDEILVEEEEKTSNNPYLDLFQSISDEDIIDERPATPDFDPNEILNAVDNIL